jgi:hypothetical protein
MLKCRSSDAFQPQLKDFIRPKEINLTNCGKVVIRKETIPDEDPNTTDFSYTKSFGTDPTTPNTFTLRDDGVQTYTNMLFGSNHTVTEAEPTSPYAFKNIDCNVAGHPSTSADQTINGRTVTFTINSDTDVLDCTYFNEKQTGAIKVTKTCKHAAAGTGDHPHAGVSFTVNGVTKQTDANGVACFDGLTFGNHDVVETVPAGYVSDDPDNTKTVNVDTVASCADATYTGETVSFHNTPLTDITVTVNSQVPGGTASTIDCGAGVVNTNNTPDDPNRGDGSTTRTDLPPGTYTCKVVVDP